MTKRTRISLNEIRTKIDQALVNKFSSRKCLSEGSQHNNPQVIAQLNQIEGEIVALEAIRDALNGDPVFLNILSC